MPSLVRSSEFVDGYTACDVGISRFRNPHSHPSGTEYSELQTRKFLDWHNGWNTRFYGEAIYEGEPDP